MLCVCPFLRFKSDDGHEDKFANLPCICHPCLPSFPSPLTLPMTFPLSHWEYSLTPTQWPPTPSERFMCSILLLVADLDLLLRCPPLSDYKHHQRRSCWFILLFGPWPRSAIRVSLLSDHPHHQRGITLLHPPSWSLTSFCH